jgi:cardiolipin synthase
VRLNFLFFKNLPEKEKTLTLSTKITLLRIFLIPVLVFAISAQMWALAFWLILIGAITDIADGKIARARNEVTMLGSCLDPVADKLFILSTYFTFAYTNSSFISIPAWFFWLVLAKEFLLIIGGLLLYMLKGVVVEAEAVGKYAMTLQTFFIAWLTVCNYAHWHPFITYQLILCAIIFFVFASLFQYFKMGILQLRVQNYGQK